MIVGMVHWSEQNGLPMAGKAQNAGSGQRNRTVALDEPLLITGISGRFPKANSMAQFQENLAHGIDMISHQTRWKHQTIPKRMGTVEDWDKFDSSFFNIVPKMAEMMDPQGRKLLEVTYEAIIDAGLSPDELRGSRTGVFVGAYGGDGTDYHVVNGVMDSSKKFHLLSKAGFMLANRISHAFDLQGPSFKVDAACSSSFIALEQAILAIRSGKCDSAIVAASAAYMNAEMIDNLTHLGALSPEGLSQVFDSKANGYVRSEAVVAIVIQKMSEARRNYATIKHVQSSTNGWNSEGIAQTSASCQEKLMRSVYANAGLDPGDVSYVEAHGSGTSSGDPTEVEALYNVFCSGVKRNRPLVIGSVKSNVGHCEPASGLVAIAKVLTAIQSGTIPANLNFQQPHPLIKPYLGKSLEVANRPTEWMGGLIGVSAYGIGGTNAHVVLEPGPIKSTAGPRTFEKLPLLLPFSGRTRQGTENSLKEAAKMAIENPDVAALLQTAYSPRISEQNYRGYTIPMFSSNSAEVNVSPQVADRRPPLWFIFPGLGSQWEGMAKEMMKFPPFEESIVECQRILQPAGIDLHQLVLSPQCPSLFTNIRHAFISIVATQVALYDLLTVIGLKPDGYIGHSCGEFLCAYADGCFTREETILAADARGRAFLEEAMDSGSMAAIGLSWKEATKRCPADVQLACNNSPTNITVSGTKEAVSKFVDQLRYEGIFAKEVNSCNTASHSKCVTEAAQLFVKYMKDICPQKRLRSSKWISTSIPEESWTSELGRYNCGDYHGNNATQPVLFYEAVQYIPDKAIVVEVSPRGFFQSLLKESLPNCTHVPIMTSSPTKDKVAFSLNSIGKLYNAGFEMNIKNLYPELKFPVAANTPCISPLVKWNHERSWNPSFVLFPKRPGKLFEFDLADGSDGYLNGHKIGNKVIYPAGGYLYIAWNALADMHGQDMQNFPIIIENVSFESATVLQPASRAMLKFSVLDQTGAFVITDGDRIAVRGNIKATAEASHKCHNNVNDIPEVNSEGVPNFLDKSEAYKELRLRGYNYSGYFQGIHRISVDGTHVELEWMENWTSFLDTMLHSTIFAAPRGRTAVPTRLASVAISPRQFHKFVSSQGAKVPTTINQYLQSVKCPGVEIKGLKTTVLQSIFGPSGHKIFKRQVFTPYWSNSAKSNTQVLVARIFDIVLQQRNISEINVVELCPDAAESIAGLYLEGVDFEDTILPRTTLITLSKSLEPTEVRERLRPLGIRIVEKERELDIHPPQEPVDLLFFSNDVAFGKFAHVIHEGTYVAVPTRNNALEKLHGFKTLASFVGLDKRYFLLQKVADTPRKLDVTHVSIASDNFLWLPELQAQLREESKTNRRIYLTSQNDHASGLVAFVKCLRKEAGGEVIRGILDPYGALQLDFENPGPLLSQIIDDDLAINVIRDGKPGTYCHTSLQQEFQDDTPTKLCRHAVVDVMKPGDMSSLRWLESRYNHFIPNVLPEGKVLCHVSHVAINFRDVMQATAKIPYDQEIPLCESILGFEYAGIGPDGRRMMGVAAREGLATTILVQEDLSTPIPDHWTFEEAATVPLAYMTAYYALMYRGRLSKGQSVLIHSGAGGVGQAAIRVAFAIGCEVFTTVGSEEKRKLIKDLFPQLKDENIGNSRDCSFEVMVMTQTKGLGVDAVLNSLAEDKFYASIRCVANHGKFLEIGSYDFFRDSPIGSSVFLKNIDFHGIRVNDIFNGCLKEKAFWAEQAPIGTQNGTIVPLKRTVFQVDEMEKAFRFMATGTHTGKIVINVRTAQGVMAVPRTFFSCDKAYIVVGGLGGLGLETSSWMVDRGVRHLIIPSRSGLTTGYQALCLRRWAKLGCVVETPKVDLSNFDKAEELIKSILEKKELGGIINSAMVIRDGLIQDLTIKDFEMAAASKVPLTKNLDALTRKHCPNLDYFVCYSSVVGGFGHEQQSNYGFSNSVMERICENRRRDGLHGLAIQWGVIGDVGFFEFKFNRSTNSNETYKGLQAQKIPSCLHFLDRALQSKDPIITSFVLADQRLKVDAMKTGLLEKIMNMFGLPDVHKLVGSTKLADLGMDSLITTELANILRNDYDLPVSPVGLRSATIEDMRSVESGLPVKFTDD